MLSEVIADSRDVNHNVTMILDHVTRVDGESSAHRIFADTDEPHVMSLEEPLTRRGWAFQERILSARIVHFTHQELIWECKTKRYCECGAIDEKSSKTGLMGSFMQTQDHNHGVVEVPEQIEYDMNQIQTTAWSLLLSPMDEWKRLIGMYTERKLTNPEDRAAAFAGIAQAFGSVFYRYDQGDDIGDFCAGLWSKQLPRTLLWSCATDSIVKKLQPCESYRIKNSTAPSWSWYSVLGKCHFLDCEDIMFPQLRLEKKFKDMNINFTMQADASTVYRYLSGGSLEITNATLFAASCDSSDRPFHLQGRNGRVYDSGTVHLLADDQDDQTRVTDLWCLYFYSACHDVPVYGWSPDDSFPEATAHISHHRSNIWTGFEDWAHSPPEVFFETEPWQETVYFGCREHYIGIALAKVGDPAGHTYQRVGLFHAEGNSCFVGKEDQPVHRDDVPPSCSFQSDIRASLYEVDRIVLL